MVIWSCPETKHVADAAVRWAPASFILLREHVRNGGTHFSADVMVSIEILFRKAIIISYVHHGGIPHGDGGGGGG